MLNRFLIISLLMFIPIITIADHIKNQPTPYYLMSNMVNKTFTRLQNEQNKIHKNPDYLRVIVREEIFPYMHIKYAGALVLGNYYQKATPIQLDSYFKAFKIYLEQFYGQSLSLYTNQSYQLIPETTVISSNTNIIVMRLNIFNYNSHEPIHFDFQWRKNSISKNWQTYDVLINGISMITTKQKEWISILRYKGIDTLTNVMLLAAKKPILLS